MTNNPGKYDKIQGGYITTSLLRCPSMAGDYRDNTGWWEWNPHYGVNEKMTYCSQANYDLNRTGKITGLRSPSRKIFIVDVWAMTGSGNEVDESLGMWRWSPDTTGNKNYGIPGAVTPPRSTSCTSTGMSPPSDSTTGMRRIRSRRSCGAGTTASQS